MLKMWMFALVFSLTSVGSIAQAEDTTPLRTYASPLGLTLGTAMNGQHTETPATPGLDTLYQSVGKKNFGLFTIQGGLYHRDVEPAPPTSMRSDAAYTGACSYTAPAHPAYTGFCASDSELPQFCYKEAEQTLALGVSAASVLRGHTLVWHRAIPEWFTKAVSVNNKCLQTDPQGRYINSDNDLINTDGHLIDATGKLVAGTTKDPAVPGGGLRRLYSPSTTLSLLESHVKTVVKQFKGRIKYWDVVNEAVNDATETATPAPGQTLTDQQTWLRDSIWAQTNENDREAYIHSAFQWAHESDPAAKLIYNDYNNTTKTNNPKSDAIYRLMQRLKAAKVPIDGVGFQAHSGATSNYDYNDILANLQRFAALGLEVQFTEVDVSIPSDVTDPDRRAYLIQKQARVYANLLSVCLRVPQCKVFITWGFTDRMFKDPSMVPDIMETLNDAGTEFPKKPAYYALQSVLKNNGKKIAPLTLEAEDLMDTKTTGAGIYIDTVADGWKMTSNGYLQDTVCFPNAPTSKLYRFGIFGQGEQAAGDGGSWPQLELRIDNHLSKSFTLASAKLKETDVDAMMEPGCHTLQLKYVNAYPGRSVTIDKIAVTARPADTTITLSKPDQSITKTICIDSTEGSGLSELELSIFAHGREAAGTWPNMQVSLANRVIANISVDSATKKEFDFKARMQPGCYALQMKFTNDYNLNGEDRNLYVDEVEAKTLPSASTQILSKPLQATTETVCVAPSSGNVARQMKIAIFAHGSPTAGVWPRMQVSLAGQILETATVGSGSKTEFDVGALLQPGCYPLELKFMNDARSESEDRNLYIDQVTATPVTISAIATLSKPDATLVRTVCAAPVSGTDFNRSSIGILAHGSPTAGIWPKMEVSLGGQVIESVTVGTSTSAEYGVSTALQPGCYDLRLKFTNDGRSSSEDRNLYIDQVAVAPATSAVIPLGHPGDQTSVVACVTTPPAGKAPPLQARINAKGSVALGVWPLMDVSLDGKSLTGAGIPVASTSLKDYFVSPLSLSAGCHMLSIKFLNDKKTSSEDRNLYVSEINVTQ